MFLKACRRWKTEEVVGGLKTAYEMKKWDSYNQGMSGIDFTNDAYKCDYRSGATFTGKSNTYPSLYWNIK